MKVSCPHCQTELLSAQINVSTDLAQCQQCQFLFKLSDYIQEIADPALSNPPVGSRISITKEGNLFTFTLPKRGFQSNQTGMLIFVIFWLSFITVWTVGASMGSILFALFSIPFWLIGFFMAYSLWKSTTEMQQLILNDKILILEKRHPLRRTTIEMTWMEIIEVRIQVLNPDSWNTSNFQTYSGRSLADSKKRSVPAFLLASESHTFFENAGVVEQEWMVKFLNAWKQKHTA